MPFNKFIVIWFIVYFNFKGYEGRSAITDYLIEKAYSVNPDLFLERLEKEIKSTNTLYLIDKFESILNGNAVKTLLKLLNESSISKGRRQYIISFLFKYDPGLAFDLINVELKHFGNTAFQLDKVIEYASEALTLGIENVWLLLWPFIQKDSEFGRKLLENTLARRDYFESNILFQLLPQKKAEFLIWLYQYYPPKEDNKYEGIVYNTTAKDAVTEFRGQLLNSLVRQGTKESLQAIEYLSEQLSNEVSSVWWLVEAKVHLIENSFTPIEPKILRKILHNSQQRVVRSSEELLLIVVESLKRLQEKLKGNNPTSYFLWDKQASKNGSKPAFKPKDENSFSDFIKMHLDYDLIERAVIVNREVEIRKSIGPNTGERTDILIQAWPDSKQTAPFSVVIEAKGCWHPEVDEAMKEQLVDRYLAEHKSNNRIYLIGWFHCLHYPNHSNHSNLSDFKQKLLEQSVVLSSSRVTIKSMVLDCSL